MLDRVSLSFRTERREVQALSDISLCVAEGEFIALLVPTGCGKSSLLRLVSDLIPPTSGAIEVRGEPASAARRCSQNEQTVVQHVDANPEAARPCDEIARLFSTLPGSYNMPSVKQGLGAGLHWRHPHRRVTDAVLHGKSISIDHIQGVPGGEEASKLRARPPCKRSPVAGSGAV